MCLPLSVVSDFLWHEFRVGLLAAIPFVVNELCVTREGECLVT